MQKAINIQHFFQKKNIYQHFDLSIVQGCHVSDNLDWALEFASSQRELMDKTKMSVLSSSLMGKKNVSSTPPLYCKEKQKQKKKKNQKKKNHNETNILEYTYAPFFFPIFHDV